MFHEGAQVRHCHQDGEKGTPHAGPPVEWHELKLKRNCQVIDHQSVGQEWTSGTENGQRLPWKRGKKNATDGRGHDHLQHSKLTVRAIQESATEPWPANQRKLKGWFRQGGPKRCAVKNQMTTSYDSARVAWCEDVLHVHTCAAWKRDSWCYRRDKEIENCGDWLLRVLWKKCIRPIAAEERSSPLEVGPQATRKATCDRWDAIGFWLSPYYQLYLYAQDLKARGAQGINVLKPATYINSKSQDLNLWRPEMIRKVYI